MNEDPFVAEVEALPGPQDTLLLVSNPRLRDGKDLRYVVPNVTSLIYPLARINFIQILPSGEEERVVAFVREYRRPERCSRRPLPPPGRRRRAAHDPFHPAQPRARWLRSGRGRRRPGRPQTGARHPARPGVARRGHA